MNLTFLNCYGQFVSFLHLDHPNTVSRIHVFERKINCYETTLKIFSLIFKKYFCKTQFSNYRKDKTQNVCFFSILKDISYDSTTFNFNP